MLGSSASLPAAVMVSVRPWDNSRNGLPSAPRLYRGDRNHGRPPPCVLQRHIVCKEESPPFGEITFGARGSPIAPAATNRLKRFRKIQVCPKDLSVLLRQFACAAWAGDSGCSASPGCGPYALTHVPCSLSVVRGGGDRRPDGGA